MTALVLLLLINIYVALTRRDVVAFDETLLGLWMRTKKQKLRRQLKDDQE